jgi:hypothetical protein
MRDILRGILFLAVCLGSRIVADGYPMLVEVAEDTERCIRLNIPEDDDAHVVFLALPSAAAEEDEENADWAPKQKKIEEYFLTQMIELTKYRVKTTLPRKFPNAPPEDMQGLMNEFLEEYEGELDSGCQVKLANPKSTSSRTMETFWFTPVVINFVRKAVRNRKEEWEATPLEGYSICFTNTNDDAPILIVVESVMTSEEAGSEDSADESPVFESAHLTPLAEQLQESITAAESVVREMGHMERREQRMRRTAEGINSRVRWFSYISVAVLLVVTYVQVTYLKRYFRKKKLL